MTEIMRKRKRTFPTPIEFLFESMRQFCFSSFFWYLYRLWPIIRVKLQFDWMNTSSDNSLVPTVVFIIPKVPSVCIERFIRNNAPWILSRFSITSWCMEVNSWLIRTVRFLSVFLHFSAYGHPLQSSHSYNSSLRPYWFPLTFFCIKNGMLIVRTSHDTLLINSEVNCTKWIFMIFLILSFLF